MASNRPFLCAIEESGQGSQLTRKLGCVLLYLCEWYACPCVAYSPLITQPACLAPSPCLPALFFAHSLYLPTLLSFSLAFRTRLMFSSVSLFPARAWYPLESFCCALACIYQLVVSLSRPLPLLPHTHPPLPTLCVWVFCGWSCGRHSQS